MRNGRTLLFVSLAVNAFLLGGIAVVVVGLLLHGPGFKGPRGFSPHPGGAFLSRILPDEALQRLQPELTGRRKIVRAAFDDARAARRAAIETLAAEPYSKEASASAFAVARDADIKAVTLAQDLLSNALLSLNDNERKAAYARLSRFMKDREGGFRGKLPPPMMDGDGPRDLDGPPPGP